MVAISQRKRLGENYVQLQGRTRKVVKAWQGLQRGTFSMETLGNLIELCSLTVAAPVNCVEEVPTLGDEPVDLREWLCDPVALASLFEQLRALSEKPNQYGSLTEEAKQIWGDEKVYHVWLWLGSRELVEHHEILLDGRFVEEVAGFARGANLRELRGIEKEMEFWEDSLALAQVVVAHARVSTAAAWLRFFGSLPEERRCYWVKDWIERGVCEKEVSERIGLCGGLFWRVDDEGGRGLRYLWKGLNAGADLQQLIDGLELRRRYNLQSFPCVYEAGSVNLELFRKVVGVLIDHGDDGIEALWLLLLKRPKSEGVFHDLLKMEADTGVKKLVVRLLLRSRNDGGGKDMDSVFRAELVEIIKLLESVDPAYYDKVVEFFGYSYWEGFYEKGAAAYLRLVLKMCRKPMPKDIESFWIWRDFVKFWEMEHLPDSSWRRLGEAWRTENDIEATRAGLDFLSVARDGAWLFLALWLRVRLTSEVLRKLGRAPEVVAKDAVETLREHPYFDLDLEKESGLVSYGLMEGQSKDWAKLVAHVRGEKILRKEVVDRLRFELEGRRVERLLWVLRERLSVLPIEVEGVEEHTALYAKSAKENRRAYGKLMRRYLQAGEMGILNHPANLKWLKDHPFLKTGVWLSGMRATSKMKSGKVIELELERRFEQVLKMGTLVGSCLSLDGCNSHSALANAADVNKQVVMAYDERGKFLGRQLVGISEEGKLVCYEVYGQNRSELEPYFAAFNVELSKRLGLLIHTGTEYELKSLVCRDWYDDYAMTEQAETTAELLEVSWGGSTGKLVV